MRGRGAVYGFGVRVWVACEMSGYALREDGDRVGWEENERVKNGKNLKFIPSPK